ncbi:MAG: class IV adenylate cyclase [Candidatus Hydrogenedentes bacterium]|nr:class IV adenylate cyclase [Candidatus Hydrogenedentota bacterium]
MRNIELKARLADWDGAPQVCERLAAAPQGEIHQVDTYFRVPGGRFKLREAKPGRTELVFYRRPDTAGPKGCDYVLEAVAPSIKGMLEDALGILAVVDKVRTLWLWHNVRIHLDEVKGLGRYIEFEAVMADGQDDSEGYDRLGTLIEAFGLQQDDMEPVSYLDLTLASPGRELAG